MDDVKKKVLLDLFASPVTLLPVVGGITALLGAWAMPGSQPLLAFGGVAAVLGGVGMFASRIVFGLEKLTNRAYEYVLEKQQADQHASLQQLHHRLAKDNDPRTERLLAQLWTLYNDLKKDVDEGKISIVAHDVLDGVNNMFKVCVDYLDRSHNLWVTASKMKGTSRDRVLEQREELIREVARSCDYLENTIDQLNAVATKRNTSDLAQMRAELDESIRVAKRAEERTDAIGHKSYNVKEFE